MYKTPIHCILIYSVIIDIMRKSTHLKDFDKFQIVIAWRLEISVWGTILSVSCSCAVVTSTYQMWRMDGETTSSLLDVCREFERRVDILTHYSWRPKGCKSPTNSYNYLQLPTILTNYYQFSVYELSATFTLCMGLCSWGERDAMLTARVCQQRQQWTYEYRKWIIYVWKTAAWYV